MDNSPEERAHAAKARSASDLDLELWSKLNPGSSLRAAAVVEQDRRKFWKTFLTHGIVSWLALIVSVVAICISAYVAIFKGAH